MISVIVPVYNTERYLHRCVDSILSQTYDNFELLLMDDGSSDSSGKICDEYVQRDPRVKAYHLQNGGPSRARNIGIDNAAGNFVAFVDSDDYIAKDMLEHMVLLIANADIAMCNFYSCTENVNKFCDHKMGSGQFDTNRIREAFIPAFYYSSMTGLGSCCNKLYNKKFITANNIRFNERLIRAEDFWFNFDCFSRANAAATTDKAFYYYEQTNANSTMHKVREKQYEDWVYNRKELLKRNEQLGLDIDYPRFYRSFLYAVSVYLRQLAKQGNAKEKIIDILLDPFYRNALQFDNLLPYHLEMINKVVRINATSGYLMYCLWSMVGK